MPTKSFVGYGGYKGATTISAAMASGASAGDVKWDLEHGYMALHLPPDDRVLGPLPGDGGEAKYGAWLMARLVLLSKKGDLSLCKNWRGICLLGVASKIFSSVLVARMEVVMESLALTLKWVFGGTGVQSTGCSSLASHAAVVRPRSREERRGGRGLGRGSFTRVVIPAADHKRHHWCRFPT
jgi:ribosomal protein S26